MKLGLLKQKRPGRDMEHLKDLRALYLGSTALACRMERFFHKAAGEPDEVFKSKLGFAKDNYVGYVPQVINYYAGWLFSDPILMSALNKGEETPLDPFYAQFKEDCDGKGVDFQDFLRARFIDALTCKEAFWVVQFPHTDVDPANRLQWEKQGLGRGTVKEFAPTECIDYELNESGKLLWIKFGREEDIASTPFQSRGIHTITFWIYTAEEFQIYSLSYPKDNPPNDETDIPKTFSAPHKLGEVPIVRMALDDGLWLADALSAPQRANWHARTKRSWLSNTQAYCKPVFTGVTADKINLGSFGIALPQDATMSWTMPPGDAALILEAEIKNTKDEFYRAANLNFMGLENNSMALVRSGLSRTIDADAGHVTVKSLAYAIRDAAQRTYALLAKGRGDKIDSFIAGGFEHLDSYDFMELVGTAVQMGIPTVPSDTYKKQFWKLLAAQSLDMDENLRIKINSEIDAADTTTPDVLIGGGAVTKLKQDSEGNKPKDKTKTTQAE